MPDGLVINCQINCFSQQHDSGQTLATSGIYIYIYVYVHAYVCTYGIYIYIYVSLRDREARILSPGHIEAGIASRREGHQPIVKTLVPGTCALVQSHRRSANFPGQL